MKGLKQIHFGITILLLGAAIYFYRDSRGLKLEEYDPQPTLKTKESTILRAKFPVIDVHEHLGQFKSQYPEECAERTIAIMDSCHIEVMIDMDGAWRDRLVESIQAYQGNYPGRFIHFVHFMSLFPDILGDPNFEGLAVSRLEESHRLGAKGLKVWKDFGTTLKDDAGKVIPGSGPVRDRLNNQIERFFPSVGRKVIPIDDPRFDPVWEKAGELNMPVLIHTGDPIAFFQPVDRFNERYEQLRLSPDWSFYGPRFPTLEELLEQRDRLLANHPNTIFIGAHFAMAAEDLEHLGRLLDTHRNFYLDLSAALPILGRQPYSAREFFIRYQDRILYGSDGTPDTKNIQAYFRFLETYDEYMKYPLQDEINQGRWRIYGIGLPDEVLQKIYYQNAANLFGLNSSSESGSLP